MTAPVDGLHSPARPAANATQFGDSVVTDQHYTPNDSDTPAAPDTTHDGISWPDPTDLPNPTRAYLPMDPELIVEPFREFIKDNAERIGVPHDAPYAGLLVAAGIALGASHRIYPRAHDTGWTEPPHLSGLVVGPPSTKKTVALNATTKLLKHVEAEEAKEYKKTRARRDAKLTSLDIQRQAAEQDLKKAASGGKRDAAKLAAAETRLEEVLDNIRKAQTHEPRLLASDTTIEKLGIICSQNPAGMVVYCDEISGLIKKMGSVGHEMDRSFYLTGYNAEGSFTVDRVSREGITIDPLAIALLGTIQPEVLRPLLQETIRSGGGDGFLARFQLLDQIRPEDVKRGVDKKPDEAAERRAQEVIRALRQQAKTLIERRDDGATDHVHFTPQAQRYMDEWSEAFDAETRNRLVVSNAAYESHRGKTVGAAMRLALLFHHIENVHGVTGSEVTLEQARRAVATIEHYLQNACELYGADQRPHVVKARLMLEKIHSGVVRDGMTTRDIQQAISQIRTQEELRLVLDVLVEHNHVRLHDRPNPGTSASRVIELHPQYKTSVTNSATSPSDAN